MTFVFRTLCYQWHQWFNPAGLAKFDEMVQRGELEVVYEIVLERK